MHHWSHSHCQWEGILQSSLLHLSRAGNLQRELINTKTSTGKKLLNCNLWFFFLNLGDSKDSSQGGFMDVLEVVELGKPRRIHLLC